MKKRNAAALRKALTRLRSKADYWSSSNISSAIREDNDIRILAEQVRKQGADKRILETFDKKIKQFSERFASGMVELLLREGQIVKDEAREAKDIFLEVLRRGFLNKGRQFEVLMAILSDTLDNLKLTENLSSLFAGDITLILDFDDILEKRRREGQEADMRAVEFQLKEARAEFKLPLQSLGQQAEFQQQLNEMLEQVASEMGRTRLGDKIWRGLTERMDLVPQIEHWHEEYLELVRGQREVGDTLENKLAFFQQYLNLSAAHYFVMRLHGLNISVSVPQDRFLDFVKNYQQIFSMSSANKGIKAVVYRYSGRFDRAYGGPFPALIGSGNLYSSYHLHSLLGYKYFIEERKKALSKTQIDNHRRFLVADWENFIIPHMLYDKANLSRYQRDIRRLREKY